jgi:hypothetical protein
MLLGTEFVFLSCICRVWVVPVDIICNWSVSLFVMMDVYCILIVNCSFYNEIHNIYNVKDQQGIADAFNNYFMSIIDKISKNDVNNKI